jgi:hypothetical protein
MLTCDARGAGRATRFSPGLAQVVGPYRFADHLVLVAGNVGRGAFVDEVEDDGDVRLGPRLAQVLSDEPAHVFSERNAELVGFGMRAPLQLGVHGDLGTRS